MFFHFVPQSGSSRCDLTSGSNDVSEVKSKFVLAHCTALRSELSFLMRCRHKDSCHSMGSHADDFEADFPLELR